MNRKKISILTALFCAAAGMVLLFGTQYIMKKTNSTEFCVSCHSMEYPKAEWEGSSHFSNPKGIRAECADCHIPQEGIHYLKAKFIALKDVWYTITNKIPDQDAYEMAKTVWEEMKQNDSATCRSCHKADATIISEQSAAAQKMHRIAQETNQTCIDCHKGIVHFMPEIEADNAGSGELAKHGGEFTSDDQTLYSLFMTPVQLADGGEVRLMPFTELTDWKETDGNLTALLKGWQQAGAESVVYSALGQRITVALLDDDAKQKVTVLQTQHDTVTDSDWKEITLEVAVPKTAVTGNLAALNNFGNNLNQTYCSGCHAPIGAEHYTANQWIGVVNSMKDRTSMSADDVRTVTIYLQRNAKDKAAAD